MAHEDTYQFWMVWNPTSRPPQVIHLTATQAQREADRLASANPGQRFYVLKGLRYSQVQAVGRTELQPPPPGLALDETIPF